MTVAELIAALKTYPPNDKVWINIPWDWDEGWKPVENVWTAEEDREDEEDVRIGVGIV